MTMKITVNKEKLKRGEGIPINGVKLCSVCRKYKKLNEFGKCSSVASGYFTYCKVCTRWRQRSKNLLHKMEFVLEYGGKCQCCGERGLDFLTVEHISGVRLVKTDSNRYFGDLALGGGLIANLKVRGWPKDNYTVLCFNCNCCKKFGRPCSHNIEEYEKYMSKLISYMSGEHKKRYNILNSRLNNDNK